jgi:sulfate adenylyltransferase
MSATRRGAVAKAERRGEETMPETTTGSDALITPYGGRLVDLRLPTEAADAERRRAVALPSIRLSPRASCDLELLACGAFSPLDRFMGRADLERVVGEMRLAGGRLWPIPITLPIDADAPVKLDSDLALRDERNDIVAVLTVEEVYPWDRRAFAIGVAGTDDPAHPLVAESRGWGEWAVSGELRVVGRALPRPFEALHLTPRAVRARLAALGRPHVVAFQTRNPPHRGHEALMLRAIADLDATLLLHPVVGVTRPGDFNAVTTALACRVLAERHLPPDRVVLALLPLAMRLVGPREALWHAIVRRNYGADHLIVGRDHAGAGRDARGRPFYGPTDAADLVAAHAAETGVTPVPSEAVVFLPDEDRYETADRLPPGARAFPLSGSRVRGDYVDRGLRPPEWLMRPEVADLVASACPARHRQGVCVWLTGLSASGKSTIAALVAAGIEERGRRVTLLDGDAVRAAFSPGLGFDRPDRDANVRRIGRLAAEIVRHHGVAVCAAVSPYRATRAEVRAVVGADRFAEVYVAAPVEVCAARDGKGLYERARRGDLHGLSGVDDPYEPPENAEIVLDAANASPAECAAEITAWLTERGFLDRTRGAMV